MQREHNWQRQYKEPIIVWGDCICVQDL
jgi:hypothetical protein